MASVDHFPRTIHIHFTCLFFFFFSLLHLQSVTQRLLLEQTTKARKCEWSCRTFSSLTLLIFHLSSTTQHNVCTPTICHRWPLPLSYSRRAKTVTGFTSGAPIATHRPQVKMLPGWSGIEWWGINNRQLNKCCRKNS